MDKYFKTTLIKAHQHSTNNRSALENSNKCGCFYCFQVYDSKEIIDNEEAKWADESTGFCSRCGVDSVIGDSSGFPVGDTIFIEAMGYVWFNGYARGHNIECFETLNTRMEKLILDDTKE